MAVTMTSVEGKPNFVFTENESVAMAHSSTSVLTYYLQAKWKERKTK